MASRPLVSGACASASIAPSKRSTGRGEDVRSRTISKLDLGASVNGANSTKKRSQSGAAITRETHDTETLPVPDISGTVNAVLARGVPFTSQLRKTSLPSRGAIDHTACDAAPQKPISPASGAALSDTSVTGSRLGAV